MILVGERIRRFRIRRGLTQEELGNMLGVTKGAIQKYENGQIKNFKAETIRKLSDIFKVPPVYFIYDETPPYMTKAVKESLIDVFGEDFNKFLHHMHDLNEIGKRKVYDYVSDMIKIPDYQI